MNLLIIGSGGREHALVWKLKQSPGVKRIFCSPGNGGTVQDATNVTLGNAADIVAFCKKETIGFVVIGPEGPLVEGLADSLRAEAIPVFGPSAKAAQLEGSKAFTKALCRKYAIPTAAYACFSDAEEAKSYVAKQGAPIVVKADGLAAGKGVVVAMSQQEALDAIDAMIGGRFGLAGASIVIEEYMQGVEASFFALTDGTHAVEFGSAQDHKRVGDGDTGANTGGMGSYTPVPFMTPALRAQIMETIIKPTVSAMAEENMPYKGVLFAGLMITQDGPRLIEYNARFGDPETQSLMMLLESDLLPALMATDEGGLDKVAIRFKNGAAVCVVLAAQGYPGDYVKGSALHHLEEAGKVPGVTLFHAGTQKVKGAIIATGGRVLGVTAIGGDFTQARARAYEAVDRIEWPEGFCRRDIGHQAA